MKTTSTYLARLRQYDLAIHDPNSLVLPFVAGMVARTIVTALDTTHWPDEMPRSACPTSRKVIGALLQQLPVDRVVGRDALRLLALRGWSTVEQFGSAQLAATTVSQSTDGRLAGRPEDFPAWIDMVEKTDPFQALVVAAQFAAQRLPGHPFALLVAENADLRTALERHLARYAVGDWFSAVAVGALTWDGNIASILAEQMLHAPSPTLPGDSWFAAA